MESLAINGASERRSRHDLDDERVAPAAPLVPHDSPLLKDLNVTLLARLGSAVMPVSELLALRTGAVLTLETLLDEPVELYLNDALVGHGEIVAIDDRFGVRITQIATG